MTAPSRFPYHLVFRKRQPNPILVFKINHMHNRFHTTSLCSLSTASPQCFYLFRPDPFLVTCGRGLPVEKGPASSRQPPLNKSRQHLPLALASAILAVQWPLQRPIGILRTTSLSRGMSFIFTLVILSLINHRSKSRFGNIII